MKSGVLTGQVALVTGGSLRIGRAISQALAKEGCGVVVHYRSSTASAMEFRRRLQRRGTPAWLVQADLTEMGAPDRVIADAKAAAGRLDILINCAALFSKQPFLDVDRASLHEQMETNLYAPVLLTRAFAKATRRGRVVNLVDRRVAGHDPRCIPYLLSKTALAEFTRAAALALAPRFTVNAVGPGPVLPPPGKSLSYLKDHAGRVPLERRVTPEDIARTVIYLVTNPAVTGQIVFVDGGQHLLGEGV